MDYFLVDVSAKQASASSRARSLWRYIDKNGHITVYKTGSATGLTMGQLVGVEYTSPPGWYERDEEETILSASTTDLFERDSDNGHAEDNGNEEDDSSRDENDEEEGEKMRMRKKCMRKKMRKRRMRKERMKEKIGKMARMVARLSSGEMSGSAKSNWSQEQKRFPCPVIRGLWYSLLRKAP